MAKLRVYQLARELNRDNAEIIRELQHMGVPVTSHSNTVEDRLAERLRRELGVYAPESEKTAPAADEIVAVEVPEVETPQAPPEFPAVETEPPRVEATTSWIPESTRISRPQMRRRRKPPRYPMDRSESSVSRPGIPSCRRFSGRRPRLLSRSSTRMRRRSSASRAAGSSSRLSHPMSRLASSARIADIGAPHDTCHGHDPALQRGLHAPPA